MERYSKLTILTITFLILTGYITFDAVYYEYMFQDSGEYVMRWQKSNYSSAAQGLAALSFVLDGILSASAFLLFFFSSARIKFYKFISYAIFSKYANLCVRLFYSEPRPFMEFDDIKVYDCIPDFGSPSGHMFTESTLYYCYFHMYLIPWVQNRKAQRAAIAKGQPLYNDDIKSGGNYQFGVVPALLGVVCLACIAAMGITRIYLGEHGYNQIILGFMYSTALTIYFFILVDEPWGRFLLRLVDKPWRESKKTLIKITLAFIVCLIVPIIIFEVPQSYTEG